MGCFDLACYVLFWMCVIFCNKEKLYKLIMCIQKLNIELPYNPAILLLGIYPVTTTIQKDTPTPMFMLALFATPSRGNNGNVH